MRWGGEKLAWVVLIVVLIVTPVLWAAVAWVSITVISDFQKWLLQF